MNATADTVPPQPGRSKTLAAWLAFAGGTLGLHRFYLHGLRDTWGWALVLPTVLGLWGVDRMNTLGQDDHLAWLLIPLLGLTISVAMLSAIVIALTPDEKWDGRFNPAGPPSSTGWGAVLAAIAALLIGGAALMGTIAFGGQKFFEWQLEGEQVAQPPSPLSPPSAASPAQPLFRIVWH
jgi:hypothetical protein